MFYTYIIQGINKMIYIYIYLKIICNKPNDFSMVSLLRKIKYYLYMIFVSIRLAFTCRGK